MRCGAVRGYASGLFGGRLRFPALPRRLPALASLLALALLLALTWLAAPRLLPLLSRLRALMQVFLLGGSGVWSGRVVGGGAPAAGRPRSPTLPDVVRSVRAGGLGGGKAPKSSNPRSSSFQHGTLCCVVRSLQVGALIREQTPRLRLRATRDDSRPEVEVDAGLSA